MKRKAKAVARFVKITCLFCTFSDMVIQRDVNVRIPQQNYSLSHSLSLCVCVCVYIYTISTCVYLFSDAYSCVIFFLLFLTDGAAKRDRGDVEIFRPLFLDVRSWKRGRSQRLLRLVSWSSTRDGQNERGLVRSGRATRDSETAIHLRWMPSDGYM